MKSFEEFCFLHVVHIGRTIAHCHIIIDIRSDVAYWWMMKTWWKMKIPGRYLTDDTLSIQLIIFELQYRVG